MTNRGKNEDEDEGIWENEFNFGILHIKIRLDGTFHKNLRKKFSFEIFTCEGRTRTGVERVNDSIFCCYTFLLIQRAACTSFLETCELKRQQVLHYLT